jgi:phosphoribosylformimino-5-aminoimidazole carboxamide ribotide isomerase
VELVPVIDLLGERVVRAMRGERSRYQPLQSPLCISSAPLDVARAYLELYPFKSIYLADLDAIQGLGRDNYTAIQELRMALPQVDLWLDAGFRLPEQLQQASALGCKAVIGSEGLQTLNEYQALLECDTNNILLSLDFSPRGFLGPDALLRQPQFWPSKVICMTLAKVGSLEGPDYSQLTSLLALSAGRRLYAAGGVRDAADVERLRAAGIHGALVASALHQGKLSPAQLARLQA